ncbi:MAG: hypothetical protein DYG98_21940 [Haliscomenobacteraceae bacterium CHB4]|nr:hypothetical protein [Haliscomenobacteraceae bacterium CHB4]
MKTLFPLLLFLQTCFLPANPNAATAAENTSSASDSLLYQRFTPPPGYQRVAADSGSFAFYLRNLPLKPSGSKVLLHDGREKSNPGLYEAVVDLPIGKKDLHQCADAVIRLRAEYLWQQGRYDKIHFNLTNGFRVDYERWRKGGRVKVVGHQTSWVQKTAASDSYATFWQYLEFVFTYAGTLSLSKELEPVALSEIQIGDVFIQGGSPGHAVIVVDMATDQAGKKVFLLAQSYMPAQEIQILKNPSDEKLSPWYSADFGEVVETPEWAFQKSDLKRFGIN